MLKHYLTLAVKVLLRRKFFTFISLFGISFTLVVLMVVAALLDHLIAPMAPETRLDRTLAVHRALMYGDHNTWGGSGGYKLFDQYARNLPGVERLSIFSNGSTVNSFVDGAKVVLDLKRTDGEFWQILDFEFLEGRAYGPSDVREARFVAVINATTRDRVFKGRSALGKTIEADGQRFQVVGVVPDVSIMRRVPYADIWVPYTTAKSDGYKSEIMGNFIAMALAKDKPSMAHIHEEFNSRVTRVELPDPKNYKALVAPFETTTQALARLSPFAARKDPNPQTARLVAFLGVLAGLFVLIPTVNLVNINISRIMERASEIGVRKAFGAPARTLVGQFLVENLLLTLVGAAIGFVLSFFVLRAINESGLLAYTQLGLNLRVFAYGVAMALAFGIVSGVYPAWRMSRLNPVDALKGGASR